MFNFTFHSLSNVGNSPWYRYSAAQYIPSCRPLGTACSTVSCNTLYLDTHAVCGIFNSQITCGCQPPYAHGNAYVCNVCDPTYDTYSPEFGECELCPTLSTGFIVGLLFGAAGFTLLLLYLNSSKLFQRLLVPFSQALIFLQVCSLLAVIDLHWPLTVRSAMSVVSLIGLNVFNSKAVGCWLTTNQTLNISLAAPAVIGALLFFGSVGASIVVWVRVRFLHNLPVARGEVLRSKYRTLAVRSFVRSVAR
jgi:hypothetical protein